MDGSRPNEDYPVNEEYLEKSFQHDLRFTKFEPVNQIMLRNVIKNMKSVSCELDPIPTSFVKENLDLILPAILDIVKTSLSQGCFPEKFKSAIVRPLLKKAGLDLVYKNYRPVSNLSFLSKVIEKVVCVQLTSKARQSGMMEDLQSAYSDYRSTETALLKVRCDILKAMDEKQAVCLVLLDLNAAFDTVSRSLLFNRLKYRFGFDGTILKWIQSYLKDRNQRVAIGRLPDGATSKTLHLHHGVLQGSVLGPVLFLLYTSPLGDICRRHNINFHGFADDQQLYLSFAPTSIGSQESCINKLQDCIAEIRSWMRTNLQKLNDDKTEFIVFGTRQSLSSVGDTTVCIGNDSISNKHIVRNLGVMFDSELKGIAHVNKLCSSLYLTIKQVSLIRNKLDYDTRKLLMQTLVLSRMDYGNSQLVGISKCHLQKLQKIQNMACRVIFGLSKYDHISVHLQELHWLKVEERIVYELALIAFKCIQGMAPDYLINLLSYSHGRQLRSSTKNKLPVPKCRLSLVQNSSFHSVAPRIWNSLPSFMLLETDINVFKKHLKTFLFKRSYAL